MAKSRGQVTKIYELRTLGYPDLDKQLSNVAKKFDLIRKAKVAAEGKIVAASDIADIKKYTEELVGLKLEEQRLRVETQKLTAEKKALNLQRAQELEALRKQRQGVTAAAGSYAELYQQYKQLYALVKSAPKGSPISFQGQTLQYDQAIAKLRELALAEQDFRRQFTRDSLLVGEYTSGIVQAFKEMGLDDLIGGQITKAQQRVKDLNADFDRLQEELKQTKAAGKETESIEKQMIENRNEVIRLDTEVARLRSDLRSTADIGNQITTSIANGFKNAKGQLASFILQYAGISALISQAQRGIGDASLASDQTTDLEIQLGGSADQADRLNKSLRELDTRTTVVGLQQIADIALRAGVTAENIEEVTAAIDKTKIAFGKDFGSIEQGTETLAKLIKIFYDDGQITGERILSVGNSIRVLANETTASVPFLTDFSGRMAGVKQIANVSLPDILGLGAGFEEFKQSSETASTALVKVIPKLATDTQKYADILGVTKESFAALIDTNPAEALIRVSETLIKSSGALDQVRTSLSNGGIDFERVVEKLNKGGGDIERVSKALADSELGSGRITTILATLGGNAETFRQRISRAGEAMDDTGAISEAFEKKNNNLAASLDKVNKRLSDFFSSKTFQTIVLAATTFVTFLLANLPIILGLVGLLTVSWIAQNTALIALRAQVIFYNLAIGANIILINALRVAHIASIAVTYAYNTALRIVTGTMRLFGLTTTAATGPLGVFLALAGILASALAGINAAFGRGAEALDANGRKMAAANEIYKEASKIFKTQIGEIDAWVAVIRSANTSVDSKRRAVEELSKINKEFSSVIKDNTIDLVALQAAYDKVTESIRAQALAQASAQLTAEKQQSLTQVTSLKQQVATEAARQSVTPVEGFNTAMVVLRDLSSDEKNILRNIQSEATSLRIGVKAATFLQEDLQIVLEELRKVEDQRIQSYQSYLDAQVVAEQKVAEIAATVAQANQQTFEVDIKALRERIAELDEEINAFQGDKKSLDKKIKERGDLQRQLDALLGTNRGTGTRGSRLTGEQKDLFKDIDAERDKLLAEEERRRIRNEVSEEDYLDNVYNINVTAIDRKLALLKGANAEERKQIAQLNLERTRAEFETNRQIYEIRAQALKEQLEITVANAEEENKRIQEDPSLQPSVKAESQLKTDEIILQATIEFNREMDKLEKGRNDISKKNAEDRARALRDIEAQIQKDRREAALAQIEDERRAGDRLLAEFKLIIAKQREAIINSNKSQSRKDAALRELDRQESFGLLTREIAQLQAELPKLKKALDEKAITEKEYAEKYEEYVKRIQELNAQLTKEAENVTSIQSAISESLRSLLKFDVDSGQAQLLAQTIAQSYDLARNAMDTFYQTEADNINRSRDLNLRRLEQEREQMLARADNKAEEDSINRQFQARQDAINREAFEKNKKLQREQAKINLAIQLSNLAVVAFAPNPLNIATLGAAGAIMYAIQAAIAVANYALNIKRINSATYEKGGLVAPTKTGGEVKGPAHKDGGVPFEYKEAEGQELMIINKRSARDRRIRTLTGTNRQIASHINVLGGGVSFAAGARETRFAEGGYLGQALQPPILPSPAYGSFGNSSAFMNEKLDELISVTENLAEQQRSLAEEQSNRIDRMKVYVVPREMTEGQNRDAKQSQIGSIL